LRQAATATNPERVQFAKVTTLTRKPCGVLLLSRCTFLFGEDFVSILSQCNSILRLAESTSQCCTNIVFTTCRTSALRMSYFNLPYLAHTPFSFQPEGYSHNFPFVWALRRALAYLYLYSFSLFYHSIRSLFITSTVLYVG